MTPLDELLVSLGACPEARAWAEGRPMSIETLRAAPDAWVAWLADHAYARATIKPARDIRSSEWTVHGRDDGPGTEKSEVYLCPQHPREPA